MSVSSRAPISSKFLKADFAGLCGSVIEEGGSVIEEASGAASAVTTGAVTVGAVAAGAVALDAATTGAGAACGWLAGFALSANTTALGKKS